MEARFAPGRGARLAVGEGGERWLGEPTLEAGGPPKRDRRVFEFPECASRACTVRYVVRLRDEARARADIDVAMLDGPLVLAPPSTWLLAPLVFEDEQAAARVRVKVVAPAPARFATGVAPLADDPETFDLRLADVWTSPYSAFGPLRRGPETIEGVDARFAIGPGRLDAGDDVLTTWLRTGGQAVQAYFGRFPVPRALVLMTVGTGRWVGGGRTLGGGGGTVFIRIGERAPARAFAEDWVLVHEMIHLAFPSVPREQGWAEEGLATFVEPFVRVSAGLIGEEAAWAGLVKGLPHGLPREGDRGLDRTPTWGRTYWGGALFFLLADIDIRERTGGRAGLRDALRGILAAGGSNAIRWSLEHTFEVADRALGVPALRELHGAMARDPYPVDLDALFASLGVVVTGGSVRFDETAPRAAIRRAMSAR